jgi:hypothetical protein
MSLSLSFSFKQTIATKIFANKFGKNLIIYNAKFHLNVGTDYNLMKIIASA